jgi:penicillin-binding protein 2
MYRSPGPSRPDELKAKTRLPLRINLFFFAIFIFFSILIVRLALLQFVEGRKLKAEEAEITNSETKIAPIRGSILDRNGYAIAKSRPVQSLYYRVEGRGKNQDEIIGLARKLEAAFAKLAKPGDKPLTADTILKLMDVGYDLNKKPTKEPSYFSIPRRIKADLSREEIAYLSEHRDELKGIEVLEESIRVYDSQSIAAQLVGYVKRFNAAQNLAYYKDKADEYLLNEDVGFDGLEYLYQEELRGKVGTRSYPINSVQRIVGKPIVTPPEKGHNLFLTIDKDVQLAAEQAITDQLVKLQDRSYGGGFGYAPNARSGYAVAMEVDTGKVIAMASMPDYDTNLWTGTMTADIYNKILPFVPNGTITTAYPDWPDEKERNKHPSSLVFMGSTIKPLSVLIGLNEKLFSTTDTYNDVGFFTFGKDNSRISNSDGHAYGRLTPTTAIEHSSNTFMSAMVAMRLYEKYGGERSKVLDVWADYLAKFGLGVKTGSDLPGELPGANDFQQNKKNSSYQSAMIYASWGQNERYTPLQLAQYAATLASRGKRMKPQFVDKITDSAGNTLQSYKPVVLNEVDFPDEYWNAVMKGMKSDAEGIAELPYNVARKTGTSTQEVGGRLVDNAVFIAFAPAERPKLAVAVVVPEGGFGRYGASPIAAKIFQAYDQAIGGLSSQAR